MSVFRKLYKSTAIIPPLVLIAILALSSFACNLSTQSTPSSTLAAAPTTANAAPDEPTAEADAPAEPTAAGEEVQPTEETAPQEADLAKAVLGFWRAKITGKEIIVFEFQEGGQTTWHYRYNNGQMKDMAGTYSIEGYTLKVDVGGEQDLTAQLEGSTLTLTGADAKVLTLQKVDGVNSSSPTASTNIAQDIAARWHDEAADEWLEFMPDGSLSISSGENNLSGTYTVNGSTLQMTLDNQENASSFEVEIDGNVLTLVAADGSFIDYVK